MIRFQMNLHTTQQQAGTEFYLLLNISLGQNLTSVAVKALKTLGGYSRTFSLGLAGPLLLGLGTSIVHYDYTRCVAQIGNFSSNNFPACLFVFVDNFYTWVVKYI